jgi:hypothetical protein
MKILGHRFGSGSAKHTEKVVPVLTFVSITCVPYRYLTEISFNNMSCFTLRVMIDIEGRLS